MTVFQRKNRLVSFRVSQEEYESLRVTAAVHGVRGISDIARFAVRKVLAIPIQEQEGFISTGEFGEDAVAKLTDKIEQMNHRMDEIAQCLELLKESAKSRQV